MASCSACKPIWELTPPPPYKILEPPVSSDAKCARFCVSALQPDNNRRLTYLFKKWIWFFPFKSQHPLEVAGDIKTAGENSRWVLRSSYCQRMSLQAALDLSDCWWELWRGNTERCLVFQRGGPDGRESYWIPLEGCNKSMCLKGIKNGWVSPLMFSTPSVSWKYVLFGVYRPPPLACWYNHMLGTEYSSYQSFFWYVLSFGFIWKLTKEELSMSIL